ncbi:MAG: prolyl-tRNA synthetase [Bacillota bacterium]|nr:prolyl-tRNA synthetase [Bacillota bacterium]
MRMSKLFAPTLREVPAEAEVISHQLLLRAGYIRKTAAGVYSYLPLAWRVLRKIEEIVRQEMDRAGGQEVLLPTLHPAEIWQESGRWDVYGKELFRLKDRHDRDFCLGPTHEEIVTDLVRREISSYRDLPKLLYQIQTKARDEIRPRLGLIRCREFIMKDLYSFDRDQEGLEQSYRTMYRAYQRVFARCGLSFKAVEADSGAIGGKDSHEFMVLADTGEGVIAYCDVCDYAANLERAVAGGKAAPAAEAAEELRPVATPGRHSVEEVTAYLGVPAERLVKTLIYRAIYRDREEPVAVLVRGDREVNETKLKNTLDALFVELADAALVEQVTGAPVGFAGPVGLKVRLLADPEAVQVVNAVVGGNKADLHLVNVNYGRDYEAAVVADLHNVSPGDPCPRCGAALKTTRGIEVGHIFKLGTKYSEALGATYLGEDGQERFIVMGSYGIGIPRTMAAAVEQNHDADGIIWPFPIAPYHVVIVPVNYAVPEQRALAEALYRELTAAGVETLIDDRDERAGVKFKDADLMGFPLRITVGPRALKEGKVELRRRASGTVSLLAQADVVAAVQAEIAAGYPQAGEEEDSAGVR